MPAMASGIEHSADGKYLFVSNVGINDVIIYKIDKNTGMLTLDMETRISGDYPKALAVFPDGHHFVSLNMTLMRSVPLRSIMRKNTA